MVKVALQTPEQNPSEMMVWGFPYAFAKRHQLIWQTETQELLYTQQTTPQALMEAQRVICTRLPGEPHPQLQCLTPGQFNLALQKVYAERNDANLNDQAWLADDLDHAIDDLGAPQDLLESQDEAPIIRLLNALLTRAIRMGASDVHLEPFENHLRVRFRLDGLLQTIQDLASPITPLITSRVKVMARLDIAEKRIPQDGRVMLNLGGHRVDLRVSTLPSSYGERVVMRILDKGAGQLLLQDLGLPAAEEQQFRQLLARPHGILLVTGPTGSGKTTTLYAGLTQLNEDKRNIMTVEDPVEYNLPGISQTQVNLKADMTFAKGLRAILRQDPDVVMIGEIRDTETAKIAVQAALTGHLVLSTLHTNTAMGAVSRLRDLGIEPYLLASSFIGVMAQRLVRRLCPHCKQLHDADEVECGHLGVEQAQIYQPQGCEVCGYTGYKGRMAVYELITLDDTLRQMIHDDQPEALMASYAHGFTSSLLQTAQQQVLQGHTSLAEVLRVTQDR